MEGTLRIGRLRKTQTALQLHLSQSDSHLLRAIEEARARIRQGKFGVCEACKRPIAEARLKSGALDAPLP
jgi:RNA polymerase-binding transcription factor DksA